MKKCGLWALLLALAMMSACARENDTEITETTSAAAETTVTEASAEVSETVVTVPTETEENPADDHSPSVSEETELEETELQKALRKAEPLWAWEDGRIYIDIDGDDFPERFDVNIDKLNSYIHVYADLRYYNTDECVWEGIGSIFDCSFSSPFNIYYDREYDEYFLIGDVGAYGGIYDKFIFTDTGIKEEHFGDSWGFGTARDEDWKAKGWISFGTLGKHFYINESLDENYIDIFNKTLGDDYEIAITFDLGQIIREYGYEDPEKQFEIFAGEFADSPQPSEYKKPYREKAEEYIIIGGQEISLRSTYVYINGNDTDITEETFEELSKLPYLYGLSLSDDSIDLNGIEKLTGLRSLDLYADTVTNGEKAGKLRELTVLSLSPDISDFSFVEYLDSVKVIEFGDTLDKPADFYAPMYKMKGLRYMLASVWEPIMTDEQAEHIRENAPWIDICTYKVG